MNKFLTKLAIFIFAFLFIATFESKSQDGFGAKGKSFVLAFLPNYHNYFYDDQYKMYDSLSMYFVSEVPTKVNINFKNRSGIDFQVTLVITDPTVIKEFKLSAFDYELWGLNQSGVLSGNNQCEAIARNTFRITSDNDIIVYAHSQAVTTSESMLVLPVSVLDNQYIVLTYPSDDQIKLGNGKTPSQFVIIASENNTKVKIIPSAPTQRNGMKEQNIILNSGEAYLVQAKISSNSTNLYDLTGSEVISDKPVAVIAGHQRTSIKSFKEDDKSSSRDFLMEQMTPVKHWGNNVTVIPFYQPSSISNFSNNDLFRILASEDNTVITFNKIDTIKLNSKQLYEGDLTKPYFIESNKPIFVCSFKKTAKETASGSDNSVSDPLMLANPPMDRVGNFYRFINLQAYERVGKTPTKVYLNHYVGIVAKESGLKTIKLDNNLLDKTLFKLIPNSKYYYANIEVTEGIHEMYCKEPFSILVYGYGYANSYGYIGGMIFKKIDVDAPNLQTNSKCFEINGIVTDSLEEDSGLLTVVSNETQKYNTNVTINTFNKYDRITTFFGKLDNIYDDGKFEIVATDSIGFESSDLYEIPGFTVGITEMNNLKTQNIPYVESDSLFFKKDYCVEFTLENYGKFPQNITKIGMKNPNTIFSLDKSFPFTIQPNEKIKVTLCDTVEVSGEYLDSLYVNGDCADRTLATVNLFRIDDLNPPSVTTQLGNCNKYVDIVITDSTKFDIGIMSVDFVDSTNCTLKDESSNSKIYTATLEVKDPYQDAYYEFFTSDSLGNNSTVSGSIPGYTIEMYPFDNSNTANNNYDFGKILIGGMVCKEIELYNYGNFTFVIDELSGYDNTLFSIPQSQFPIEILPKSSKKINVCFSYYKSGADTLRDTFDIEFNCLKQIAPMEAIVEPVNINQDSKCDLKVLISAEQAIFENYILQSKPNPASNSVKIEFGLAEKTDIVLSIFDILGELKAEISENQLNSGKYELEIDVSKFEQGLYFYQLTTNSGIYTKKMVVNR